eukprot:6405180-Pyramimonas_sp.AAC.1
MWLGPFEEGEICDAPREEDWFYNGPRDGGECCEYDCLDAVGMRKTNRRKEVQRRPIENHAPSRDIGTDQSPTSHV